MAIRPNNPDPKGTPEEQLRGWKQIKAWAKGVLRDTTKKIRQQRQLIKSAQTKIRYYSGSGPADFGSRCTNLTVEVKTIAAQANKRGLYITSTCDGRPGDGRHTSTSLHYPQNNADGKGHAIDLAGSWSAMCSFQRWLIKEYGHRSFQELFGPDNSSEANAKSGSPYSLADGSGLENLHDTHVHVAPYRGHIRVQDKSKLRLWRKKLRTRINWGKKLQKRQANAKKDIKDADKNIKRLSASEPTAISDKGLELIASFEGWYNKPYNDPVGHCTIGYGHLLHRGSCTAADYEEWGTISKKKGLQLLRSDTHIAAEAVKSAVKVPLTQNQFDALVSFTFNCGSGALSSSTLLKRLNAGDYLSAANELLKWVYADAKKLPGLERRRKAERKLFLAK